MADTYVIYEGQTGAVSNYGFTFEYLSTTHVKVTVNDVPVAFSFLSTYMISILPNPIGTVKIYRDTPDEAITTFTDGSVLLDDDLNSAFVQSIYISQEAKDTATDEMQTTLEIMDGLLEDTTAARDLAASKATDATNAAAAALSSQTAASGSASSAATSASSASASATSASEDAAAVQAALTSLEDGPVVSINGETGIVSGFLKTTDIGNTVQARSADLDAIRTLSPVNDDIIQRKSGVWSRRTVTQFLTDLAAAGAAVITSGILLLTGTSSVGATLSLREGSTNGSNTVSLKAPDAMASNVTFTLPSADGTAGQVLTTDGAGNLSMGDAGGGLTLLSTQPASGAASVTFVSGFSTTYDHYVFHIEGVWASVPPAELQAVVSIDGGATFLSAGYSSARTNLTAGAAVQGSSSTAALRIAQDSAGSGTPISGVAHLSLMNPLATWTGHAVANSNGTTAVFGGQVSAGGRVNAIRFAFASGNMTGTIKMYGAKK